MKRTKTQKGITLVALIITIIVLLILAVVAIRAVQGNNIIAYAENSRDNYKAAQANEATILDSYTNKVEQVMAVPISEAKGKVLSTEKTTDVVDEYGNIIKLPAGFMIRIDDTTNNADNVTEGIVVEDCTNTTTKGSQFVWIPVGKINHLDKDGNKKTTTLELKRYIFKGAKSERGEVDNSLTKINPGDQLKTSASTSWYRIEALKNDTKVNTQAIDIEMFISTTNSNGGYYLGRYEAGKENNVLVCKKSKTVYADINQAKAANLSREMYKNNDETNVTSDLANGYAWTTAVLFIQTFSTETDASTYSYLNKSTSFAATGENGDEYCNINDMSGNAAEWTTESTFNGSGWDYACTRRGGYYNSTAGSKGNYTSSMSASNQLYINVSIFDSFRTVLYL